MIALNENNCNIQDDIELGLMDIGSNFKIGNDEFIVLEHTVGSTKVIAKEIIYTNMEFGDNSDWRQSPIRNLLNGEYFDKISGKNWKNNIIPMMRDLTSLDGLEDYGFCFDKITLLSASEYAEYHKILGLKSIYPGWWYTITPVSAPSNGCARSVCFVSSNGVLNWVDCGCCGGVRPFLTLDSSIRVNK